MRCLFSLVLLLLFLPLLRAHQVPSMTIEAEFTADADFTLRINLDPRVFLAEVPSTLPPVPAAWYLEQSPAELEETRRAALAYLNTNIAIRFGDQPLPLPDMEWVPMDGATNAPPKPDAAEVHLLATAQGKRPAPGTPFVLAFGNNAKVSLILLISIAGEHERRPQVLFPGETGRPVTLPAVPVASAPLPDDAAPAEQAMPVAKAQNSRRRLAVGLLAAGAFALLILLARMMRRRKKVG